MNKRWKTSNTSVYDLGYHIIWCPKYRRKVLVNGIDERLKELIKQKCDDNEWEIVQMDVMPDHVHIFIKAKPTDSVAFIIAQLKGYTSHELRKEYPELWSRLPNLWTRSYYAESCGCMSEDKIIKYIENQKFNSSND